MRSRDIRERLRRNNAHALASVTDDAVRRPTQPAGPWRNGRKTEQKMENYFRVFTDFGSVGVLHFTDALAVRRAPRRIKGKQQQKKNKIRLFSSELKRNETERQFS